jgi:hypothetical protein
MEKSISAWLFYIIPTIRKKSNQLKERAAGCGTLPQAYSLPCYPIRFSFPCGCETCQALKEELKSRTLVLSQYKWYPAEEKIVNQGIWGKRLGGR